MSEKITHDAALLTIHHVNNEIAAIVNKYIGKISILSDNPTFDELLTRVRSSTDNSIYIEGGIISVSDYYMQQLTVELEEYLRSIKSEYNSSVKELDGSRVYSNMGKYIDLTMFYDSIAYELPIEIGRLFGPGSESHVHLYMIIYYIQRYTKLLCIESEYPPIVFIITDTSDVQTNQEDVKVIINDILSHCTKGDAKITDILQEMSDTPNKAVRVDDFIEWENYLISCDDLLFGGVESELRTKLIESPPRTSGEFAFYLESLVNNIFFCKFGMDIADGNDAYYIPPSVNLYLAVKKYEQDAILSSIELTNIDEAVVIDQEPFSWLLTVNPDDIALIRNRGGLGFIRQAIRDVFTECKRSEIISYNEIALKSMSKVNESIKKYNSERDKLIDEMVGYGLSKRSICLGTSILITLAGLAVPSMSFIAGVYGIAVGTSMLDEIRRSNINEKKLNELNMDSKAICVRYIENK